MNRNDWCVPKQRYIQHPAELPIHFREIPRTFSRVVGLPNENCGVICFDSARPVCVSAILEVSVTVHGDTQSFRGMVRWVRSTGRRFEVAVCPMTREDAFTARMSEQVCHIEAFRRSTGRRMDLGKATREWIRIHAPNFPNLWVEEAV